MFEEKKESNPPKSCKNVKSKKREKEEEKNVSRYGNLRFTEAMVEKLKRLKKQFPCWNFSARD